MRRSSAQQLEGMSLTVKSEQHGHSSVRLQGMRRAIANQMAKSHAEIPGSISSMKSTSVVFHCLAYFP